MNNDTESGGGLGTGIAIGFSLTLILGIIAYYLYSKIVKSNK